VFLHFIPSRARFLDLIRWQDVLSPETLDGINLFAL
jgi:hypothetical protein